MGTSLFEREITRRDFLRQAAIFTGGLALSQLIPGCETPEEEFSPKPKTKELENIPRDGDIVVVDGTFSLLRKNKRYLLFREAFEQYRRLTKFDQYRRRIFLSTAIDLRRYPIGEISRLPTIIDPFTGGLKRNKPAGGEILMFFSGFLDDSGVPYTTIRPSKDTFVVKRKELEKDDWSFFDSFFFTHGVRGIDEYKTADTTNPEGDIRHGLEFGETIIEQLPLAQVNIIAYSAGGPPAIEFAKRHPGVVNNLFLISVPARGLRPTIERQFKARAVHELLQRIGIEEGLTEYLFAIWKDKKYQQELDEFSRSFTAQGRGLYTASSINDEVVPPESSRLEGAVNIAEAMGGSANPIDGHGRPLSNGRVIEMVRKAIGKNLAAV